MRCLLGIDIGTSGTKTVLFDENAVVLASCTKEYPLYQPQNGWAEQDPEDWWRAVCESCADVVKSSGVDPNNIAGIGLSGQMHGLVMLDENGKPLRHSIIWCDTRTEKECAEITKLVGADKLIDITANPALPGFTASKILWVRNNEPEVYAKCKKILLPKDYIRYMLTGEYATEVSDASGMQLLDIKNRCWSDEVLRLLNIDKSLLGRVYESVEVTGSVTKDASALTGLAVGTPVVGGAGDNAAAAVGVGVVKDGRAFATIGTSGVVFAHMSKPVIDPKGRVHTFCCAVPGAWHVMGVTQAAGLSLKWFRDNFCGDYIERAENEGVDPYYLMDKDAAKVPVGANKLIYLPYLMGERTPHLNGSCRGVFFGLSAMHGKPELIRAVMEGVVYSLCDCCDVLREMNCVPAVLQACGGGGTSKLWRQMLADALACRVSTVQSKEGPALGVAILAGVGTGVYSSVEDACDRLIKKNPEQLPDEENTKKYTAMHRIYKELYPALRCSFTALAETEV